MAHTLVKFIQDEGMDEDYKDEYWHLSTTACGDPQKFCTNEVYGEGQGNAKGTVKIRQKGGITCPECLKQIKQIKSIKL